MMRSRIEMMMKQEKWTMCMEVETFPSNEPSILTPFIEARDGHKDGRRPKGQRGR